MKITCINNGYYNNQSKILANKRSVSFGCERKYETAFALYSDREQLKKTDAEIIRLTEKLKRVQDNLDRNIEEKAKLEKSIKESEEEYKAFSPSPYEFMEDVARGKKIKKRKDMDRSFDIGLDKWSPSENRATEFTASDGFPLYTP